MTLVQLKHFLELARSGSFSVSARKLHLTQPALSRSIKSLEEEFGQALFERMGKKNNLTAFGQHVLSQAQEVVDGANNLKQSGQQLLSGQTGKVRIGLGSGPGALLTLPLLKLMANAYPKATLDIVRGPATNLLQALRDRQLDALVLDIRSLQPTSDLLVEALCEMPGAFMCRPGHPLSQRQSVTWNCITDYPIASTPLSDEIARILVERFGPDAHPDAMVNLRCEEVASLIEVARSTNAVVLAVRDLGPDLIALPMTPPLNASARFGWVSLRARTPSPLCGYLHLAVQKALVE